MTWFFALWFYSSVVTAEPRYDELFPYYLEACAGTQVVDLLHPNDSGGPFGHAALYLKGVCWDSTENYPKMQLCQNYGPAEAAQEDWGVGISVNPIFHNANWVAIPSKQKSLRGGLRADEPLSPQVRSLTIQQALPYFAGITLNPKFTGGQADTGLNDREYAAQYGFVSDYAQNFGRTLYCARVPVRPPVMARVVRYLNQLNERYRNQQERHYEWSMFFDNCAHTVYNALALTGLWSTEDVESKRWSQLFKIFGVANMNFAIPGNIYLHALTVGNEPLSLDIYSLYMDRGLWSSIMEDGQLPYRHGFLEEVVDIHRFENQLFDTRSELKVFDLVEALSDYQSAFVPILGSKIQAFTQFIQPLGAPNKVLLTKLNAEPTVRSLARNFKKFKLFYQQAQSRIDRDLDLTKMPDSQRRFAKTLQQTPRFKAFVRRYRSLLKENLAQVSAVLAENPRP